MGLSALYIGATGLKTHGSGMQNIGNNLANVNTVGFKATDMHFSTLMSQTLTSASNPLTVGFSQAGQGVGLGAVLTNFQNGGFMDGSATTDLAITGKGFFRVERDDKIRYTRAGNFRFDKSGFLVDPSGFRVQGKPITDGVAGATGDIRLPLDDNGEITVPSKVTSEVMMGMNLGTMTDATVSTGNPFFALFEAWNGADSEGQPLGANAAGYDNTIRVYDSQGNGHDLTVHVDKVTVSNASGKSYYEFVVGTAPEADGRAGIAGTSGAGLLMTGTLTFSSAGDLEDMTAFTYDGAGDPRDLANWTPAGLSESGAPSFSMTFAGQPPGTADIGLSFGLTGTGWTNAPASAADVGHDKTLLPGMADAKKGSFATTSRGATSTTVYQTQDGTPMGWLMNLEVDASGTLVGYFTNGVHEELGRVSLYNFVNEWGLRREGGNHFSATDASGEAVEGEADTLNYGSIAQNTLEGSNVDMAEEFTRMIITERGFQANSKVVTTQDQILQVLYQLKK
jgi:flagellar hook protein FlgE